MKSLVNQFAVANQVRMERSYFKGSILIIEGGTDARLLEKFVDDSACKIVIANGKENAVGAADILAGDGVAGVATLVDADFWHADGYTSANPNIIATDEHDMEMVLFCSRALENVLGELGSRQKIASLADDPRSILIASASSIGYLRWYSQAKSLGLRFDGLNLRNFIDLQTLSVDRRRLVHTVL